MCQHWALLLICRCTGGFASNVSDRETPHMNETAYMENRISYDWQQHWRTIKRPRLVHEFLKQLHNPKLLLIFRH